MLDYAMTVLRRSMAHWAGADTWFALVSYIAMGILALVATGAAEDALSQDVQTALSWVAVAWLLLLIFLITPYRLWVEQIEEVNKLREHAAPKLTVLTGGSRIFRKTNQYSKEKLTTEIRIGVHNDSTEAVNGAEVIVANVVSLDGKETRDINWNLEADNFRGPPSITINGGDTKYYLVANFIEPVDMGSMPMADFVTMTNAGKEPPRFDVFQVGPETLGEGKKYRLKLRISGINSPAYDAYFLIGIDESGNFEFVSDHTDEDNVTR